VRRAALASAKVGRRVGLIDREPMRDIAGSETGDADRSVDRDGVRTRLWRSTRAGLSGVVSWIVPPVCIACRRALGGHDALCAACWSQIAFIRAPLCDRLGLPLPFGGGAGETLISAAAAAEPPVYDRARAVGVFERDGVLQRLIHALKYHDRHDGRRLFTRWLQEAGRELLADADLIVPIPLSRWRLLRRQFNQSAILAQGLSRASGIPWQARTLVRTRSTPPQVGLTSQQRRLNVRGAFAVPGRARRHVQGRSLLLIDDVITTGATVEAATRALKAAGAARVDVLALGLVTEPGAVTL
jgi:ComF family protein